MSTGLQEKVSFSLDENRILILASQVFIGFEYEAFFERGFARLPRYNQNLQLLNLLLILCSTILLIGPTTYHRIVGADNDTDRLLTFTTHSVEWALHPLALALGLSLFCCTSTIANDSLAMSVAVFFFIAAFLTWFIGPYMARSRLKQKGGTMHYYTTPLNVRLRHVLTESRVMLPGAQALLGFQLITFYMEDFLKLSAFLQWAHLISLFFISIAVIMLIAPAAFHRIADLGEATERSYEFASWMVLLAAIPLGIGLTGDLFLVLLKTAMDPFWAAVGSGAILATSFSLWFGYALYIRFRFKRSSPQAKST